MLDFIRTFKVCRQAKILNYTADVTLLGVKHCESMNYFLHKLTNALKHMQEHLCCRLVSSTQCPSALEIDNSGLALLLSYLLSLNLL